MRARHVQYGLCTRLSRPNAKRKENKETHRHSIRTKIIMIIICSAASAWLEIKHAALIVLCLLVLVC